MNQICETTTAIDRMGTFSQMNVKSFSIAINDTTSAASRRHCQTTVPKERTMATPALSSRGQRSTNAKLQWDHPLMGPHPTD